MKTMGRSVRASDFNNRNVIRSVLDHHAHFFIPKASIVHFINCMFNK
jgi:hypothetical protein